MIINKERNVSGSAVVYKSIKNSNDGYINIALSCEHVCDSIMTFNTFSYKDKKYVNKKEEGPCIALVKDKDEDIAIIAFLSKEKMNEVDTQFEFNLDLLQEVYAVGCGLSESPRFTEGKITALTPEAKNISNIRTNVPIVPGDSGCGLFSKDNRLIGISNSIRKLDFNGISYPIEGISNFKPLSLFKTKFDTSHSKALLERNTPPKLIFDYLWIINSQIGN
jgi:S1-C subfamily serine protease